MPDEFEREIYAGQSAEVLNRPEQCISSRVSADIHSRAPSSSRWTE